MRRGQRLYATDVLSAAVGGGACGACLRREYLGREEV